MAYQTLTAAWYLDANPDPTHELLLFDWNGQGVSQPTELQLDVRPVTAPVPNFPPAPLMLPAGSNEAASLHAVPCGFVRIEVTDHAQGETAITRIAYADLAPGRYSLGAHTRVRVYGSLWGGNAGVPVEVQAAVLPTDGSGDWLRYTVPITALAASGNVNVPIPQCARYVELLDNAGNPGATSSINMSLVTRVVAKRDYQGGTIQPSWSPLAIPSRGSTTADRNINVLNNDASNANDANVVFWLRF